MKVNAANKSVIFCESNAEVLHCLFLLYIDARQYRYVMNDLDTWDWEPEKLDDLYQLCLDNYYERREDFNKLMQNKVPDWEKKLNDLDRTDMRYWNRCNNEYQTIFAVWNTFTDFDHDSLEVSMMIDAMDEGDLWEDYDFRIFMENLRHGFIDYEYRVTFSKRLAEKYSPSFAKTILKNTGDLGERDTNIDFIKNCIRIVKSAMNGEK